MKKEDYQMKKTQTTPDIIIKHEDGLSMNYALNGLKVISQLDVNGLNQFAHIYDELENFLSRSNNAASQPKYMVEKEAAAYMRTSSTRVSYLRRNGDLKHISFGNRNVYRTEDIDAYMEGASTL